jgi:hypothetical protein
VLESVISKDHNNNAEVKNWADFTAAKNRLKPVVHKINLEKGRTLASTEIK